MYTQFALVIVIGLSITTVHAQESDLLTAHQTCDPHRAVISPMNKVRSQWESGFESCQQVEELWRQSGLWRQTTSSKDKEKAATEADLDKVNAYLKSKGK